MEPGRDLTRTEVQVWLSPVLMRVASKGGNGWLELEGYLRRYLNDLLADLKVPETVALKIDYTAESQQGEPYPYRISINGEQCRLPIRTGAAGDIPARELAHFAACDIHTNCELIVSPQLSANLQERWSTDESMASLKNLSNEVFHRFLTEAARRGVALERGRNGLQAFKESKPAEQTPEWLFEASISGLDNIALKLHLSKPQYEHAMADSKMSEMLGMMKDGLFYELGILLPQVSLAVYQSLKENEFRIQFNDLRSPIHEGLGLEEFLVNDTPDRLALLRLTGERAINPANGSECAKVLDQDDAKEICERAGLTTWDPVQYLILTLSAEVRRHAGQFLNQAIVRYLLDQLRKAFPALIDAAESRVELHQLTHILRDLLDEQLSIRDLRGILEALLMMETPLGTDESKGIGFSSETMDGLRISQSRYISNKYTRGENTIVVFLLDREMETLLMEGGSLLPDEAAQIIGALTQELGDLPPTAQNPLILTKMEIRRKLKQLIQKEFPQVEVLCYQDLSPDLNIQPIARIALN